MFEDQITSVEGPLGKFQTKEEACVGDMDSGKFQEVTWLTSVADVRNPPEMETKRNHSQKPRLFCGTIVSLGDPS